MFSNDLREEIRAKLKLHTPKDLAATMDVALLVEEKMGPSWKGVGSGQSKTFQPNRSHEGFKG